MKRLPFQFTAKILLAASLAATCGLVALPHFSRQFA